MEPVELSAWSLVGWLHSLQEGDVGHCWARWQTRVELLREVGDWSRVTSETCTKEPFRAAQAIMDACPWGAYIVKDVLSNGDHDLGLTKAVHHEIPLAARTVPICQPTHRLGPEK